MTGTRNLLTAGVYCLLMASIRERSRKDGTTTWAVLWRDADDGKQTSRTFEDQREARLLKDFLDANGNSFALAAKAAARMRSQAPTVGAVVEAHIEGLTGVLPGTRSKYHRMAAKHITPALGAYPVDTLERADVSRWVNSLEISGKTKRNVHSILSAALTEAEKAGVVPGNVAKGIRMPSGETRREPVFLTRAQVETMADTVPDAHATLVHFLAGTGARWGEVTALDVRDVDLTGERGVVSITKAWKRDRGQDVLGAPKTKRGRRMVTIGPRLTELVREHVYARATSELLFQRPGGGQLTNYWFYAHVWNPTLVDLTDQLPARPRVHDLRHTHASWLIQAGVPLPVIQRRLGHESITVTSDTYGHLTDDADRLAADALDSLDG